MSRGSKELTDENIAYFLEYMGKKLVSSRKLEEDFLHPKNAQKLIRDIQKLSESMDLESINSWLQEQVTSTGKRRFWSAVRNITYTDRLPIRDRVIIAPVADAIRAHTGIDDLNEAVASLLPKKLAKQLEGDLAELKQRRSQL